VKSNVSAQCEKKAYKLLAYIMDQKKAAWIEKSKVKINIERKLKTCLGIMCFA